MDDQQVDRSTADVDDLRGLLAGALTSTAPQLQPGAVGLESEHFLVHVDRDGTPRGRASLDELTALLDDHPHLDPRAPLARPAQREPSV